MEADRDLVRKAAAMAMIELTGEEEAEFARDLGVIMDYMERISEMDTGDLEPMEHVLPVQNVFRDDVPEDSENTDELLKCASETKDGWYVVPSVVDTL